jgi:hypothetical protein
MHMVVAPFVKVVVLPLVATSPFCLICVNEEDGYGKSKHNCNTWRSFYFRLKTTCFDPCTGPSSGLKWIVRGVYIV